MEQARWIYRFNNYKKALHTLEQGVILAKERELSLLEKQGLIQGFEFTHELAWKVMQDFIKEQGTDKVYGSKDATRKALSVEIISNGEGWMQMIQDRNLTSHTYEEELSDQIYNRILNSYFDLFKSFEKDMDKLCNLD